MSRAPFPTLRRRAPKEPSDEHAHHDGRQHRRRACRLSGQRGLRDLPDHALFADGRRRRRMGVRRGSEHLGQCAGRPGNAGRRRRSRRAPRRLAVRRADHHLHSLAGFASDAAKHVQDRRRADANGLPCRGTRDFNVAICAISAQSCASCTDAEHSSANPVGRAVITSAWSPKIDSADVANEREAT